MSTSCLIFAWDFLVHTLLHITIILRLSKDFKGLCKSTFCQCYYTVGWTSLKVEGQHILRSKQNWVDLWAQHLGVDELLRAVYSKQWLDYPLWNKSGFDSHLKNYIALTWINSLYGIFYHNHYMSNNPNPNWMVYLVRTSFCLQLVPKLLPCEQIYVPTMWVIQVHTHRYTHANWRSCRQQCSDFVIHEWFLCFSADKLSLTSRSELCWEATDGTCVCVCVRGENTLQSHLPSHTHAHQSIPPRFSPPPC